MPTHIKLDNQMLVDQAEICLAFNRHFEDAGNLFEKTYASSSINTNSDMCRPPDLHQCFSFKPFTLRSVYEEIATMNAKSSPGEDNVDPFFYKTSCSNYCRASHPYF